MGVVNCERRRGLLVEGKAVVNCERRSLPVEGEV